MHTTFAPHVAATIGGVRLVNPLETPDWDAKVAQLPEATFFHSSAWAKVLQSSYGYSPVYFTGHEGDKITSLLPFMEINSWLTGRRGISLPFTDDCIPLGAEANAFGTLFEQAKAHGKARRWKYLECRGGRRSLGDVPTSCSYFNHRLPLQPDEAALFAGFDSSVRRAVRKAEQNKLTVEFLQTPEAMRSFYDLFCQTRQRHGVPPQPYSFFANVQEHVLAKNRGWVVLARQGDQVVAGAVFFQFGRSVIYKYGASNENFQHLRANNLVMWEAIRRFAREGFTMLDFGRTSLHNNGLRRFKASWGAQERQLNYLRYDLRQGRFVSSQESVSPGLHSLYKFTPVLVSRLIGLLLYKHIAGLFLSFDWNQLGDWT